MNLKITKSGISLLLLMAGIFSFAQSIDFGFSIGTGSTYLAESIDKSVDVNYKTPVSIAIDLKYTPDNSNFGIVWRYQYTNTSVSGRKWFTSFNDNFRATVNDSSVFFLLEYLKNNENALVIGGNFGMGYTKQIIQFTDEDYTISSEFPSITLAGIINYKLNDKLSLKIQPGLQFFDPINGLKSSKYNFAKEDIHFLTQFGLAYKLN